MATRPRHDLFVSYAAADRAWVEGYLLDALRQAGVDVHSDAAFALGAPRLRAFEEAVTQSGRVLLVRSEEWRQFVGPDVPYHATCPNLPPGDGARGSATPVATPT